MKKVDSILVTVTVYSRRELAADDIDNRGQDKEGNYRYRLVHDRVESADSEVRQEQLATLLSTALRKLVRFFSDGNQALQGVDIHLTLLPRSGQAGIVLPSELFRDWAVWEPSVYLDSLST